MINAFFFFKMTAPTQKSVNIYFFVFSKGLYQKAEALYHMGEFEFALVFYHRGQKLRPQIQQFRLGIQKAQEAIIHVIGSKQFSTVCEQVAFETPLRALNHLFFSAIFKALPV